MTANSSESGLSLTISLMLFGTQAGKTGLLDPHHAELNYHPEVPSLL